MFVQDTLDGVTFGPLTAEQVDEVIAYLKRQGDPRYKPTIVYEEDEVDENMLTSYENFLEEKKAVEG